VETNTTKGKRGVEGHYVGGKKKNGGGARRGALKTLIGRGWGRILSEKKGGKIRHAVS